MIAKAGLVLLAIITVLLGVTVFGGAELWSYRIVSPADADLHSKLTEMGLDGYELVAARRASDGKDQNPMFSYEMVFKRRLGLLEGALAKWQKDKREADGEAALNEYLRKMGSDPQKGQ